MQRTLLCILLFLTVCVIRASQTQDQQIGLRLIAVRTEAEASSLLQQIQSGQPFESIAKEHSIDSTAKAGGYLGAFRLSDLRADLQRAVIGLAPGQMSPVTPMNGQYFILQRLTPDEANWIPLYNAGLDAFEKARYDDAGRSFSQALPYAEKLLPVDYRLEDNLHGLAEAYRLQKKYVEAEPFYKRYLALRWGGSAPDVLDRFSALLALSYFQDSQFAEARRNFQEALERAPLSEEAYEAMSAILFKAELMSEAQAVMERAAGLFPASRNVRYRLAQLYRGIQKTKQARDAFEQVSRMKTAAGVAPAAERLEQSIVYQKLGSVHTELVELDEAAAAYKKALEFTPDSIDARLGLGDAYLQQGKTEDALSEYNRAVAADPKNAAAQFRVADANLRLGRFAEASAAAAKVLSIDATHRKAYYVLATAQLRVGRQEEGERQLAAYQKLEAQARAEIDRGRNIVVLNRGAAATFLEERKEEALDLFRKATETYPDSPTAYLNLGTAQSKLGQHKAAAETFQKMLAQGISDSFLVSWNLAREYRSLEDVENSRRHGTVYLQNVDLALREALEAELE